MDSIAFFTMLAGLLSILGILWIGFRAIENDKKKINEIFDTLDDSGIKDEKEIK